MDVTAEIKRYGAQELAAAAGVALATVTRARGTGRLLATAAGERMRKALMNGSVSPDKPSVYEELRREELRIKRLKADALERDVYVAAGELIPAADVQDRLGAGALAIRHGMEATRRAVLAASNETVPEGGRGGAGCGQHEPSRRGEIGDVEGWGGGLMPYANAEAGREAQRRYRERRRSPRSCADCGVDISHRSWAGRCDASLVQDEKLERGAERGEPPPLRAPAANTVLPSGV